MNLISIILIYTNPTVKRSMTMGRAMNPRKLSSGCGATVNLAYHYSHDHVRRWQTLLLSPRINSTV